MPVLSAPSTSMWNLPPAFSDATLADKSNVPAEVTVTEYSSHSPERTKPTNRPPPLASWTSTPSPAR